MIGAGIYSSRGEPLYVHRPIANNGLIVSGSNREQRLYCVSSQTALGMITGLDGNTLSSNGDWIVDNPKNRPGVLQLRTRSLNTTDQGIYTCTVPDSNGNQIIISIGLYLTGFSGEKQYFVTLLHHMIISNLTEGPTISNLTYQEENRTMTCVSTGSPATTVSWIKDGQNLITDDSTDYTLTQTITNRVSSTYSNVLTVSEGVSVAGTYNCTVTNDLGSDSDIVMAVGEFI